ncbi:MAG TPA: hypothetical protein VGN57_08135 [Pirellulaceae bacterium]|jgi:uncharacterized membrane protein|nr:hypothetical protein [Pirellulaceae bacterium]
MAISAPEARRPARFEDQLTVFWMLTTLFTLATMTLGLGATAYDALRASASDSSGASLAVVDYARFATAVTGLLLLGMTALVLKVRRVAPPRAITLFVLIIATAGLLWAMLTGATAQDFFSADRSSDPVSVRSIR